MGKKQKEENPDNVYGELMSPVTFPGGPFF